MTGDRITVKAMPASPREMLQVWGETFPEPGTYYVMKAASEGGAAGADPFEAWFLRELERVSRERFLTTQQAIWEALDTLLRSHGVDSPSGLDSWQLRQSLFDLSGASTARMVGLRIPQDVSQRLAAIGFTPPAILDFPALAYRMGLVYDRLNSRQALPWDELRQMVEAKPLSSMEREAVQFARRRAGLGLQPIFDDVGRVWTAERELMPLRRIVTTALTERQGTRAVAREFGNSQRARGIIRDAERVIRTEMAEARAWGVWGAQGKAWDDDTLLFRHTSQSACKACLMLFKLPNGMPRLYRKSEVEAADALGYNRGPREEWHVRVGTIHPNCVCPSFQKWHESMARIFEGNAPMYAEMMQKMKVFKEAA